MDLSRLGRDEAVIDVAVPMLAAARREDGDGESRVDRG
jgi:hypothetical protein